MKFTFHNSNVILELVPSSVIFSGQSSAADAKLLKHGYVAPRLKSSVQKV